MKTIETKISKSGATIYYVDGKRTSRENAMFIQRMNDAEASRLAKIEAEKAERENELATVNNEVADGGKTFTTVKAENAAHAVEILGELNLSNVTFVYHGDTNEHDAPVVYRHFDGIKDGHDTCFGLIEIVINGKLDTVRFCNNYREQFTDIKIGDAKYTIGDKGEINLIDEPTADNEIEEAEYAAFVERIRARALADETLQKRYVDAKSQVKCDISKYGYTRWYFKGKNSDKWECDQTKAFACLTRRGLRISTFVFFHEDETAVIDSNGYDESAFDLLPTVDELNDCRSDIEKEFDEFAAEDTDRDARFNHGERHAEKLTAKLRKFDPTAKVTYDIDEDDKDTFFMTYDGICGGVCGTLDATEDSFHDLKKTQAEIAADEVKDDDSKLAELFQDREDKRRAAFHSSFDSDESKAARDANKAVEEFIGNVAKDLRAIAPEGLSVVDSWDSSDLDAPKFVVIELATDKRTCYNKIAEVKAALKTVAEISDGTDEVTEITDNVVSDIFNRESITVGTHAEAWTLIESTANDIFAFDFEQSGIENNDNFVQRNFKNVHRGAPEYKTFSFDEIFIDDRLNHVNFKNGNRSVRIFIATPDTPDKPTRKADTVKADETQGYIFTTTKAYSGCSWQAAHYSKLERIDYRCKILGDSEHFDGSLYREVVFYDPDRAHAWAVKTADGKVIISGHDKPDFDKIVEAVKAYENAEVTDTVNLNGTTEIGDDTVKFFNGKFFSVFSRKYHGAIVDAGSLHYCVFNDGDTEVYDVSGHEVSYDEFMQIMAQRAKHLPDEPQPPTNGKHNNDSDNKDETKMATETKISANENTAATVIEVKTFDSGRFTVKLNGKRIALKVLEQPPYYDSASSDTEIIFNGRKFRNVGHIRVVTDYCNVFADENGYGFFVSGISGDVWSLGKGMTPIRDMSNEIAQIHINEQFQAAREFADKLARVDRLSDEQINAVITAIFDGNHDSTAVKKLIDDFKTENFNEAQKVAARLEEIIDGEIELAGMARLTAYFAPYKAGKHVERKVRADSKPIDESAFDMLPTVDELNDTRSDIEKEFDEFAAEDTDRDARFNHGERHAAKLEKQLRELDPTVEVTYDINEDGEDVFYLRFGKYVDRAPFATLDAVEETFHLWREDDEPTETKPTVDDQIETLEADEAVIEAKINVLTAQFDETFKQSEDADKAFNRAWLNCESSSVQSPLKTKSDTLHAALDRICDELQPLRQRNADLTSELVDLYGRHSDLAGVKIVNINGTFKRVDVAPAKVADMPAVNAKIFLRQGLTATPPV